MAVVAILVVKSLLHVRARVDLVMKAAGIPKNSSGLGGFVNGAHALVTPALVMAAAIECKDARLGLLLGTCRGQGTGGDAEVTPLGGRYIVTPRGPGGIEQAHSQASAQVDFLCGLRRAFRAACCELPGAVRDRHRTTRR
jgi:hypothetical protein